MGFMPFVNPIIKSMLRRKNRLMKKGKLEQAGALAIRIGDAIRRYNSNRLALTDSKSGSKVLWSRVKEITGKGRQLI